MLFRESETIELKEIVVDEIKKEIMRLPTATVENYTLAFGMTVRWSGWTIPTAYHCKSAIW